MSNNCAATMSYNRKITFLINTTTELRPSHTTTKSHQKQQYTSHIIQLCIYHLIQHINSLLKQQYNCAAIISYNKKLPYIATVYLTYFTTVKLPPHFTTMKLPPHTPIWSNSTPQISYNCAVTISYNRKALNSSNSTPPISYIRYHLKQQSSHHTNNTTF
jgi:hypothetical protein